MKKIIFILVIISLFMVGCDYDYEYRAKWSSLKGEITKEELQDYFSLMLKSQWSKSNIKINNNSWKEFNLTDNRKKYFFEFTTKGNNYFAEIIEYPKALLIDKHYSVVIKIYIERKNQND